jgi:hypothetical protein
MLTFDVSLPSQPKIGRDIDKSQAYETILYIERGIYRDIFKAIDEFTALRFIATGASPAAKRTRILSMTQHA